MASRLLAFLRAGLILTLVVAMLPASASETKTYTYDALGRLVTVSSSGTVNNGHTDAIAYDPAGNRTSFNSGTGSVSVTISIGNPSANEGSVLAFPVTLSAAPLTNVTVNYASADGTAIAGTDYTAVSGTLSIPAGQTSGTIDVSTIDDNATGESNEQMTVALSSPSSNATIATGTGTGTIVEDGDTGWASTLTAGSYQICSRGECYTEYGYGLGFGSMSNTSFGSYTIYDLYSKSFPSPVVVFTMAGSSTAPSNSGWTSITVPGVGTLTRSSASYSTSSNTATWQWSNSSTVTSGTVTIQ